MKNKLLIIFAIYFLVTSIGIVYGTHSCGSKISNSLWGITMSGEDKCTCNHDSKKDHDKDCCKDDFSWVKAKTDDTKIQSGFQLTKSDFSLAIFYTLLARLNFKLIDGAAAFEVSHSPPLPGTPLFLRVRTLLI